MAHADYEAVINIGTYVSGPLFSVHYLDEDPREKHSKYYHPNPDECEHLGQLGQDVERVCPLLLFLFIILRKEVEGYLLNRLKDKPAHYGYQIRDQPELSLDS
jgi:hypothetical protein